MAAGASVTKPCRPLSPRLDLPGDRRPTNCRSALFTGSPADGAGGIWAGRPVREVMTQDADAFLAWLEGDPPPGGESRAQLLARCGRWLAKHVDIPGRHGVIASASTIRAMLLNVLGAPLHSFARIDVHPLSITELRSDGRRWNFCLLRDDIKGECSTLSR